MAATVSADPNPTVGCSLRRQPAGSDRLWQGLVRLVALLAANSSDWFCSRVDHHGPRTSSASTLSLRVEPWPNRSRLHLLMTTRSSLRASAPYSGSASQRSRSSKSPFGRDRGEGSTSRCSTPTESSKPSAIECALLAPTRTTERSWCSAFPTDLRRCVVPCVPVHRDLFPRLYLGNTVPTTNETVSLSQDRLSIKLSLVPVRIQTLRCCWIESVRSFLLSHRPKLGPNLFLAQDDEAQALIERTVPRDVRERRERDRWMVHSSGPRSHPFRQSLPHSFVLRVGTTLICST